jgi:hypothetical protein
MKRTDYGDVLKIYRDFLPFVEVPLHTTGVQHSWFLAYTDVCQQLGHVLAPHFLRIHQNWTFHCRHAVLGSCVVVVCKNDAICVGTA